MNPFQAKTIIPNNLSEKSIFFKNILSRTYWEVYQETITIMINHVDDAKDIILSKPMRDNWKYIEQRLIMENYFGMESDLSILAGIKMKKIRSLLSLLSLYLL